MTSTLLRRLGSALCLLACFSCFAKADTITVGGTGSATPLLRLLFDEFRKQAPDAALKIVDPPLGSGGAMRALQSGRIDIAVVGRPLSLEEASIGGTIFEFADTPLAFVTSDGQRPKGFTLDELARVYNGQLNQWDSGLPIRLVLRASFEFDTLQIRSMSPAIAMADSAARKRPGMHITNDDLDTLNLLTQTPASFGTATLGLLRSTGSRLHVLPINGVTPSLAALKDGRYPWHKSLSLVHAVNASPTTVSFVQFLRSSKASAFLLQNDYLSMAR